MNYVSVPKENGAAGACVLCEAALFHRDKPLTLFEPGAKLAESIGLGGQCRRLALFQRPGRMVDCWNKR